MYPGRNAFFEILRVTHHVVSSEDPLYDELKRLPEQPEIVAAFPPNDTREMTSAALVFISHNTADDANVEKLAAALERHRLNVWHDGAQLKGGNWWRKEIFEALKAMDRLVIVLSSRSIVSEGVLRGVNSAHAQGKRIVPVSFLPFDVFQPLLKNQPDMKEITEQQVIFLHDGSGGGVEAAIQRVADEPDHVLIERLTEFRDNPYVGLNSFGEKQSHLFFGRELEVDSLEQRFAGGSRVIAVQGPSGSGKSSLVSAGLIPAFAQL